MMTPVFSKKKTEIPILKTIASQKTGIEELKTQILLHNSSENIEKKYWLMAEKAYQLLQKDRMKNIDKNLVKEEIMKNGLTNFNLYQFVKAYPK